MESRFSSLFIYDKEKTEFLKKLRIIKQNLIHVQGLPKYLVNVNILKSRKYFGQYGTIKNIIISKKINQENNKEVYSVYITYKNNIEAACAILCVDSLLIFGKIIRAFFGTTKYCNYFLNNKTCPNLKKCMTILTSIIFNLNERFIIGNIFNRNFYFILSLKL